MEKITIYLDTAKRSGWYCLKYIAYRGWHMMGKDGSFEISDMYTRYHFNSRRNLIRTYVKANGNNFKDETDNFSRENRDFVVKSVK